jgi:hypothetical protein
MRILRAAALLLLCALIPLSLEAQQPAPAPTPAPVASDPQAVSLLQKSLAVQVGVAQVTDVTLTGTAQRIAGSDDETGTATLKATVAGDSRIDLSFPSGSRSEIRNHDAVPLPGILPPGVPTTVAQALQPAGAWFGPDGVIHGMANHNLMTDAAWFFPVATLTKIFSSQAYVLSYIGPESMNGQSVMHLQVSQPVPASMNAPQQIAALMQHLSQMDLYFDSINLLPIALVFNIHPDNNDLIDIPAEIEFSNYKPVNGIQVPIHVQKYLNNGLVLDLQISNATFNTGLGATSFQLQ